MRGRVRAPGPLLPPHGELSLDSHAHGRFHYKQALWYDHDNQEAELGLQEVYGDALEGDLLRISNGEFSRICTSSSLRFSMSM
jgi:hypothetical protein